MYNQYPYFMPFNGQFNQQNNIRESLEEKINLLEKKIHLLENRLNKLENNSKFNDEKTEPTDMYMI